MREGRSRRTSSGTETSVVQIIKTMEQLQTIKDRLTELRPRRESHKKSLSQLSAQLSSLSIVDVKTEVIQETLDLWKQLKIVIKHLYEKEPDSDVINDLLSDCLSLFLLISVKAGLLT